MEAGITEESCVPKKHTASVFVVSITNNMPLSVEELLELFDTQEIKFRNFLTNMCDTNEISLENLVEKVLESSLCYSHLLTEETLEPFLYALSVRMIVVSAHNIDMQGREADNIWNRATLKLSPESQRLLCLIPSDNLYKERKDLTSVFVNAKKCFEGKHRVVYEKLFAPVEKMLEQYDKALSELQRECLDIILKEDREDDREDEGEL